MFKSVYKIIELVGASETSWEEAAKNVVEMASKSLDDMRVVEVTKLDMHIEDGEVVAYRARVNVSFRYEPKEAVDYRILAGK
ncbi:MAG: dodecin domain-containing protein, partial [Proteobacteria bacterium]|nr:dodecin domain-containing protein [Pseudomonadota bacterium]